jgi:hypothetical protein
MGYPVGPLLAALADRILHNLDLIESMAPKWGTPEQDRAPFSDTQLLISLLGVLVFPHEKAPAALGTIARSRRSIATRADPGSGPGSSLGSFCSSTFTVCPTKGPRLLALS